MATTNRAPLVGTSVSRSPRHDTLRPLLAANAPPVTARLGLRFTDRPDNGTKRPGDARRFDDPTEAHASLALRVGDATALDFYLDHARVHAGTRGSTIEQGYAAWCADRAGGRDALLLAPTNELVRELNLRAQADLPTIGDIRVLLHDDTTVGIGESIVTRRNDRRLPITSTDWVKNGDRWRVDAITEHGGLRATHADTHRTGDPSTDLRHGPVVMGRG